MGTLNRNILPDGWTRGFLNQICEMKSGEAITSIAISADGPFPCYGGNGIRGFTNKYTHDGSFPVIGRQGALCGNVNFVSGKFFASEHAVVVRPKSDKIDPKWFSYSLEKMNLNQYSESSAQPGLSVNKLLLLETSYPEQISEQKSIATVLADTDTLIQSLEKLIEKKRLIKKGAAQELLTGKRRLPGFAKSTELKSTELGLIPREWRVENMAAIGQCLIGLTYRPSNVRTAGTLVLRSSNIQDERLCFLDNVFVEMDIPNRAITREGDLLICVRNGSRNLIGKCVLVDKATAGSAFGAFMSVFRTKNSPFILFAFRSEYMKRQINEVLGATINQITSKDLNSFKIILPDDEKEERAISAILLDMESEINALQEKLEKTRLIRNGLMQELLTGRIRLI